MLKNKRGSRLGRETPSAMTLRDAMQRAAHLPPQDASVTIQPPTDECRTGDSVSAARTSTLGARDLDVILQKLKLLEFGLYGLQQYGRNAPLDVEDIGPFYRLAEEIQSDVLGLQERLAPPPRDTGV
jgi:hypothetical protein